MKNIISILIVCFTCSLNYAQITQPTISVTDGPCSGYDLIQDGNKLVRTSDCSHDTPDVVSGTTYTLSATSNTPNNLDGITTLDLVMIQHGLLYGFEDDLQIYKSDWDQDGVVTTYDLMAMRSTILGNTSITPAYHFIPAGETIPTLDPFDIQVDYSTLEFTIDDYNQNRMEVRVIKTGDLN